MDKDRKLGQKFGMTAQEVQSTIRNANNRLSDDNSYRPGQTLRARLEAQLNEDSPVPPTRAQLRQRLEW